MCLNFCLIVFRSKSFFIMVLLRTIRQFFFRRYRCYSCFNAKVGRHHVGKQHVRRYHVGKQHVGKYHEGRYHVGKQHVGRDHLGKHIMWEDTINVSNSYLSNATGHGLACHVNGCHAPLTEHGSAL